MKISFIYPCLLAFALTACGGSSDSKKSDNIGGVTTTNLETKDVTNTAVCDDASKPLNIFGTFEQIYAATNGTLQTTTRIRFEENGNGQDGILIMEISCATGSASASNKGRASYRRQGNMIELTQALLIKAESTNSSTSSCNAKVDIPKLTLLVETKNSCLILSAAGEKATFIPSAKGI